MFRHERAQRGRYRQFFQLGVEALGGAEPGIDAEVIALAVDLISALGLQELAVHLNTLGCPECRPAYRQALLAYLTPHENQLCVDCQRRFRQNPLRVLDCKVSRCIEIASKAPTSLDLACAACRQHWDGVLADLDLWGVAYQIDHKLVRGLDYYTRTTFELICSSGNLGSQNTLAGGGRYDGLVATLGGPPTPAVGFAMGLERLLLALGEEKPPLASLVQIYCVSRDTSTRRTLIPLVHTLRQQGIAVEMDHRGASIKSQMKRADRLGCQLAIIIGEEERARNVLLLRDMKTSQQEEIPFSEALSQIVQRFRF
jgi:histidyl-tRNA synthetase